MVEKKRSLRPKDVYTTYDAARICNANIASIKNWISKGLLRAFRTPGGHYRVKRRDLELFVQKYHMPYPFEEKAQKILYLLDRDSATEAVLRNAAATHTMRVFQDPLEALLNIGLDRPDVFVFDAGPRGAEGVRLLELLQSCPDTRNIQFVLLVSDMSASMAADLRKRWNIEDIVDRADIGTGLVRALHRLL